ncbi:hypothetical protein [Chakrabartyella piscis]|uniref:hypothetical protein n=1 Tax=Chakrabartyella piscis TaxID=2918914 RepID=UPI00295857E2|nr:hypothetical protein [Chakrabartyella piscis]
MIRKKLAFTGILLASALLPTICFGAWYEGNPLIAHALGESDGKIELNSKEAFIESWGRGYAVMEADFMYTTDGVLVVRHDFDSDGSYYRLEQEIPSEGLVMNSSTYLNSKIVYEQTPMVAEDLIYLMAEYPDVYIVTDTKSTDLELTKKMFTEIVKICKTTGNEAVLDRLVPQIYTDGMFDVINNIYEFPEWVYTLYLNYNPNYEQIATFCNTKGINTVAVSTERVTTATTAIFHNKGIKVYAHTINRYLYAQDAFDKGADGIYTDKIYPYELEWLGLENSRTITTTTRSSGGTTYTYDVISLLGVDYVKLRDMTDTARFMVTYDVGNNALNILKNRMFTTIGNEMFLQEDGNLVTEKSDITLIGDGVDLDMQVIMVDNEIYVPLDEMFVWLLKG